MTPTPSEALTPGETAAAVEAARQMREMMGAEAIASARRIRDLEAEVRILREVAAELVRAAGWAGAGLLFPGTIGSDRAAVIRAVRAALVQARDAGVPGVYLSGGGRQ